MSPRFYSMIAALVFAVVAVLQLARAILGVSIVIGNTAVPVSASWGACAVALILAWLGYRASRA